MGCPALQYLAASGIGTLVMDGDSVEMSNLHRQVLFNEEDIGRNKATVAAERLQLMNPHIHVYAYTDFFSKEYQNLIQDHDVILDATDNYEARYLLNAICREFKKPLISASIYQYDAQLSVFNYEEGPCHQCLYPAPPSEAVNCSLAGVLSVLPGVASTLQATEALKVLLKLDGILSGQLLCFNVLTMCFKQFSIAKQDCACHPKVEFDRKPTPKVDDYVISPQALHQLLQSLDNEYQLIDVRQSYEREICHIGGTLVPFSLEQFDKARPIVIYCRSGVRSAQALSYFLSAGFEHVQSLAGGILKWQSEIDPSLTPY